LGDAEESVYPENVTPESFPAPVYADTVLTQNFEDAKRYFLDSLLEINYANAR
jgi:hypothetical protein